MSHTRLQLRDDVRRAVLADAVRPTLGPRSKCALIARKRGSPLVCNDGVTIGEPEKADATVPE